MVRALASHQCSLGTIGYDSQTEDHVWVEFIGSRLCTKRFLSGYSGRIVLHPC